MTWVKVEREHRCSRCRQVASVTWRYYTGLSASHAVCEPCVEEYRALNRRTR